MVKIRMFQVGKKKRRSFRIVVMDSRKKRNGRYIQNLGIYNPHDSIHSFKIDLEKLDYWKKNGAQLTRTVSDIEKKARKNEEALKS